MNLKHLTDKILLEDTKKLATSERELTVKALHHLKEIDRRKLFSDLGFASLHDYCVRELKYTDASAHRRISSCRLLAEIPELENKIERGSLNLTNAASLSHFFKDEKITDKAKKVEIIAKVDGLSTRECDLKLMQLSQNPVEKKHCLWINESTLDRIKEYRALKGTVESYEEIILESVSIAHAELEKTKFKLVKNPGKLTVSEARIPTASVKREVFLRDKKCVKCGSRFGLQYDHKRPYSLGGKATPENIRILCHNCNQRERIRQRL